jgi:opacity protein-like surface antigen
VFRVGLGLALALVLAAPAMAQQPTAPAKQAPAAKVGASGAAIPDNKGDISFSYAYMNVTAMKSGVHESYPSGWTFSGAKRLARGVSLMASFSGFIGDNIESIDVRQNQEPAKYYMYMGGVRFSTKSNAMASGKHMLVKPFAEVQYGGANDNATQMNHFSAMTVGGGIDLQVSQKLSIRVSGGMPMFFFFGPVHLGYQFQAGFVVPFHKQ